MCQKEIIRAALALCALFMVSGSAGTSGPLYSIIDLGTLGGSTSVALGINNLGQVVGSADDVSGKRRAFLWQNGTMTDLGTLPGANYSEAWDINNLSVVCGGSSGSGSAWTPFVWDNGVMTQLPHLSGAPTGDTTAFALNDSAQIVGVSLGTGGFERAVLWQNNTIMDLGTLGGPFSIAWDINANGVIVGKATTASAERAFRWESGTMTDLGTLGGEASDAFGCNNVGQIVGWAQSGGPAYQACAWDGARVENIGVMGGFTASMADAVNNFGYVVGDDSNGVGFLYTPLHGLLFLEALLPSGHGWSQFSPRDINDVGQIVGAATIGGTRHAFLMNPGPVPTLSLTWLFMLAVALVFAGTRLLRRGASQLAH